MRMLSALLLLAACGGPSQQQVIETPTATAPARHWEAPPANTADVDRDRLIQQFDDMQDTQNAYREASQDAAKPPPDSPVPGAPRKAPVEQAPSATKTAPVGQATTPRKAPVEQAPK